MRLQGDREVFFVLAGGQRIKGDLEGGQSDIRGTTHQLKINRAFTPGAPGKKLVTQKCYLVGKTMVAMHDAVDAAFRNLVTAAKLHFCFRHTTARTYQMKFSLCRPHGPGPNANG